MGHDFDHPFDTNKIELHTYFLNMSTKYSLPLIWEKYTASFFFVYKVSVLSDSHKYCQEEGDQMAMEGIRCRPLLWVWSS